MSAEQPTFNQLSEQHDSGHKKMTVLVERSGDKISTGHYTGERLKNGQYVVEVTASNGEKVYRTVPAEALSDERQAELAETMAGAPQHDEASIDTTPRSELIEMVDERNEAVEPTVENDQDNPESLSEDTEAEEHLSAAIQESAESFVKGNHEAISAFNSTEVAIMQTIGQALETVPHLKVGNISVESAVQEFMDTITMLRSYYQQQEATITQLAPAAARLSEASEELRRVARHISEQQTLSDEASWSTRKLDDSSEEVNAQVRVITRVTQEREPQLAQLTPYLDQLQHDQWGRETSLAQFEHTLKQLEDSEGSLYRSSQELDGLAQDLQKLAAHQIK